MYSDLKKLYMLVSVLMLAFFCHIFYFIWIYSQIFLFLADSYLPTVKNAATWSVMVVCSFHLDILFLKLFVSLLLWGEKNNKIV